MLFVGRILCITARGSLPSRRVVRTGAWVCFYGCHHALAVPRYRQASFVVK